MVAGQKGWLTTNLVILGARVQSLCFLCWAKMRLFLVAVAANGDFMATEPNTKDAFKAGGGEEEM